MSEGGKANNQFGAVSLLQLFNEFVRRSRLRLSILATNLNDYTDSRLPLKELCHEIQPN